MRAAFLAAFLAFAGAIFQGVAAESSFADSFALKDGSRQAGKPLNGLSVEAGKASWLATGCLAFSQDGAISSSSAGSAAAKLELPEGVSSLELSLDCSPRTEKQAWIGVGLNGTAVTSNETTWPGGLMLILSDKGYATVFIDGTSQKLASKKIDSFKADGLNKLLLRYDSLSNSVWASVNGQELLSDFGLNAKSFTPNVSFAGLSCFGVSAEARMANFSLKVQADPSNAKKARALSKGDAYRVLFIGDSITLSMPAEKHKWALTCGMAASIPENDYVHKLCAKLSGELKGRKVEHMVLANGGGVVKNYSGRIREYRDFQPDVVVIQFGENERAGVPVFVTEYTALLNDVKSLSPAPLVLCAGLWNPANGGSYGGASAEMEAAIEKMAKEAGAGFAPVASYARDPECFGFGETPGVKWHPNDKGMQGYADSLFAAWAKLRSGK